MERLSGSTLCFLASVLCGLLAVLTDVVNGETCRKAVLHEKWTQAKLSRRRTSDTSYFECDNGCCGESDDQYCCPNDDDDDDDDDDDAGTSSGLVTGFSVSIALLILAVVVVVLGCMCYRARQKRSQRGTAPAGGRWRHPTVATTLSSASLPPSYEQSIVQPPATPNHAYSPPSYEEVMADISPSAPPLTPHPHDSVVTPVTSGRVRGKDNPAFFI